MGETSGIAWTDATWNPWIGCTKISPACANCYAERERAVKALGVEWGKGKPRHRTSADNWREPFRWDRKCAKEGRRMRVFCASLADVFDEEVPDAWRDEVFATMALTPNLDWLVLTKRAAKMREYIESLGRDWVLRLSKAINRSDAMIRASDSPGRLTPRWPLLNVWLGVTAEDQPRADDRIPDLLATPAAKRFVSCEPLLGAVDLKHLDPKPFGAKANALSGKWAWTDGPIRTETPALDWVIVGGESGPKARPMHPDWVRSLRDHCAAARVPFFFKQWGEWSPVFMEEDEEGRFGAAYSIDGCGAPDALHKPDQECLFWQDGDLVHWPEVTGRSAIGARRTGRKAAGNLLDGRQHREVPSV